MYVYINIYIYMHTYTFEYSACIQCLCVYMHTRRQRRKTRVLQKPLAQIWAPRTMPALKIEKQNNTYCNICKVLGRQCRPQ